MIRQLQIDALWGQKEIEQARLPDQTELSSQTATNRLTQI